MNLKTKSVAVLTAFLLALGVAAIPHAARAQANNAAKPDPALVAAAQKIFKGIADDDADAVKPLVVKHYAKRVTKESLRPPTTGPKLDIAYDSHVKVLRETEDDAVVQTTMFAPTSSDVPKGDADKLDLYMVKEGDDWLAGAPDKKEAANDATMTGGWYHEGSFTYCPNRGLAYLGSHFSNKLHCRATAVCR